jgi:hypothetical protein
VRPGGGLSKMAKMKISVIPFEDEKKSSTKKRKSSKYTSVVSNGAKDSTATIGFEANAASLPAIGTQCHA